MVERIRAAGRLLWEMAPRLIVVSFLAFAAACANPVTGPSEAPTQAVAARQVFAAGLPLLWSPAPGCAPVTPFPAVVGTDPQRTLEAEAGLRGFWPTSEVRTVTTNHTAQDFVIADFVRVGDAWRVCNWAAATREEIRCTVEHCG